MNPLFWNGIKIPMHKLDAMVPPRPKVMAILMQAMFRQGLPDGWGKESRVVHKDKHSR